MNQIVSEISQMYNSPKIVQNKYTFNENGDISNNLKSLHVVKLSYDELMKINESIDNFFNEKDYNTINRSSLNEYQNDKDFSDVNNGYGLFEYIGEFEKIVPSSFEYIYWAKKNKSDIYMNAYGIYDSLNIKKRDPLLRNKIIGFDNITESNEVYKVPDYDFILKHGEKNYGAFYKINEITSLAIPSLSKPVIITSVNIPYSIYSMQPISQSVYTYNVDTEEYMFESYTLTEFAKLLNDISENGIREPLYLNLNGEFLYTDDIKTRLTLLAAKILEFPTIPVNLYLSEEDVITDKMSDVMSNNKYNKIYYSPTSLNGFLSPSIVLYENNPSINISGIDNKYHLNNYDTMYLPNNVIAKIFNNDLYIKNKENPVSDELQKIIDENFKNAEASISNEINDVLERLKNDSDESDNE